MHQPASTTGMLGATATTRIPRQPPARPETSQGRRMPKREIVRSLRRPNSGLPTKDRRPPTPATSARLPGAWSSPTSDLILRARVTSNGAISIRAMLMYASAYRTTKPHPTRSTTLGRVCARSSRDEDYRGPIGTPLLETKLYLPRPRHGLVLRARLRDRLDHGLASKLMLVSAPAGFGKTTLLVDWRASAAAAERQDHHRLVVAGLGRQRPRDVLDLRDRGSPHSVARHRGRRARTAAGTPTAAGPARAHHPAQRPGHRGARRRAAARRLPRHRLARRARRHGVLHRPPSVSTCTW